MQPIQKKGFSQNLFQIPMADSHADSVGVNVPNTKIVSKTLIILIFC